ncbi:hypothetical protein [Segatella sp.]
MDLNQINPVLMLATLTQQIVEQEKELAAKKDSAEQETSAEHSSVKASLSENLLKRGNLLMQMGDKDGAGKDMKRYLELNPEKVGELTGEFKAEGREHCR